MKRRILVASGLVMALFLANPALNAAHAQSKGKKAPAAAKGGKATAAEIAEGKVLVAKSDCLTCHKVDVNLVGPAYKDVAKKYPATEANYTKLAQKVIDGGAGSFGQIPMSAHPALSLADAKKMVKYVLSVK